MKVVRGSHVPSMTIYLGKAIMNRSTCQHKYLRSPQEKTS